MLRLIRALAVVGVIIVSVSVLAWYLAFGVGRAMPDRLTVTGIAGPALVTWLEAGDAVVRIARAEDEPAALGVVHALGKPWTLLVLRQAALGRLSEWYGESTASFDHHVHFVGIPAQAAAAWRGLPADRKSNLAAYAAGVNAAMRSGRVRNNAPLAALDVIPEPWEPWHSVAIQRLVEYLAAAAPSDSVIRAVTTVLRVPQVPVAASSTGADSTGAESTGADSTGADSTGALVLDRPAVPTTLTSARAAVDRLLADRDRLSDFLALAGLEHAAVWVMDSNPEAIFARYVWGSSAEPPVTTVRVEAAASVRELVTWVGSPLPLAARDADGARATIPSARLLLGRQAADLQTEWIELEVRDVGSEVVERHTEGAWLRLGLPQDTVAVMLTTTQPVDPSLSGTGQLMFGAAALSIGRGGPPIVEGGSSHSMNSVTLLSFAPEAGELATALAEATPQDEGVFDLTGSPWARAGIQRLLDALQIDSTWATPDSDAVAYLRNWNASYDRASIGATLFEPLARTDTLPHRRLQLVVDSLGKVHGSDRRTWRWERDSTSWLRLPGGPGSVKDGPIPRRFDPVPLARRGHPTSPACGTSPEWVRRPAPAAWEGRLPASAALPLTFRRPAVPYDVFLARFRASTEPLPLRPLRAPGDKTESTSLTPPP